MRVFIRTCRLTAPKPGLIAVNSAGRRFVNEAVSYHDFVEAMYRSHETVDTMPAWLICDWRFVQRYGLGAIKPGERRLKRFVEDGYITVADTIENLAGEINVDPKGLSATVSRANLHAGEGVDHDFDKGGDTFNQFNGDPGHTPNPCLGPIQSPPYVAIAVWPAEIGCSVGLSTTVDGEVMGPDGDVIAGPLCLRERHVIDHVGDLSRARYHAWSGCRVRLQGCHARCTLQGGNLKPFRNRLMSQARTVTQKIIARAAGKDTVASGEIVTCRVDLAMIHDSGGPRRVTPILETLGAPIWDPDRVVLVSDHYVPAFDPESARILDLSRDFARKHGIRHFYDMQGICHVVLPERGHLRPGMFAVGGDSHSPTGGALGCFMFGMGATDMAGVLATGETWTRVPETIRIEVTGSPTVGVSAKDIMLVLCNRLGMNGGDGQVVEFTGEYVAHLPVPERMTLCNMAAELGAQTGIIAGDSITAEFIRLAGADPGNYTDWQSDPDAPLRNTHFIDASRLHPQVAAPHSPANAAPVEAAIGTRIDQAYIGACTGAKLADLHMAARILKDRTVAPGTRLLVAPASQRTMSLAAEDGTLAALASAGAILMPSGCGACAGYGAGVLADGEVCIASTARNFRGRMGSPLSRVYLGNPYTVAAAAVAGEIRDPRGFPGWTGHVTRDSRIPRARVWSFGDQIDTDVLAPGIYMKSPLAELAGHCLESVDPGFANNVSKGDVICAGENFGMGSSREQAAQALVFLGITAVLAPSFGHIFYRNAINHGLMALICRDAASIPAGHHLEIDPVSGLVHDLDSRYRHDCEPMPEHLLDLLSAGGLVPFLKRQFRVQEPANS